METRCAVSAISPVGALRFVKQGLLVAGGQNGNGTYLSTSEMYLGSKWSKRPSQALIITLLIAMLNDDHMIKQIILRDTTDQLVYTAIYMVICSLQCQKY